MRRWVCGVESGGGAGTGKSDISAAGSNVCGAVQHWFLIMQPTGAWHQPHPFAIARLYRTQYRRTASSAATAKINALYRSEIQNQTEQNQNETNRSKENILSMRCRVTSAEWIELSGVDSASASFTDFDSESESATFECECSEYFSYARHVFALLWVWLSVCVCNFLSTPNPNTNTNPCALILLALPARFHSIRAATP